MFLNTKYLTPINSYRKLLTGIIRYKTFYQLS